MATRRPPSPARATVSRCYSGADLAFKKIDSLLRGHWAAELAEIVKSGMFRRIVLAPAVPAHGRLTRGGLQMLAQPSGDPVLIKDIAAELKRHGVSSRGVDCEIVLLDAESDADLDAIAKRYANEPATLWCGAAGLARALAQEPPRAARPLNQPHLVIVGSRHPVTLRQVEVFGAARPDCLAPMTVEPSFVGRVRTTLETFGCCVVVPALPSGLTESGGGGADCPRPGAAFRPSSAARRADGDRRGDIRCSLPRPESDPA